MALCPFARHRLIPPGSNDPRIIPVGAVLHVDAGNASSLYDYFSGPSGGIESHFHVQLDGDIEQYRDTAYEADANYRGNSWVSGGRRYGLISIETQGYEYGEWTTAQLASIKRLLRWLADTHDFPLQKAPGWQGPGVGYHVMFGAPGPWTPEAKSCPGDRRIEQFHDELVPWMDGDWFDMATKEDLKEAIVEVLRDPDQGIVTRTGDHWSLRYTIDWLAERLYDTPHHVWYYINPYSGVTHSYILRRIGRFLRLIPKANTSAAKAARKSGDA